MNAKQSSRELRYQALLQLLRTADALWNASRVFFARWDLSPSQFNILNLLRDETGGLSQVELGRQLITHRSNVTGLVDRLEKRGLVHRRNVAADRRAYRIVLTQTGRKLVEQIIPHYSEVADRIWGDFSADRATQVTTAMKELEDEAQRLTASWQP